MAFLTPEKSRLLEHPGIGFSRVPISTLRAVFASLRPAWSLVLLDRSELERHRSPAAEDFLPELSRGKVTLPASRVSLHGTRGLRPLIEDQRGRAEQAEKEEASASPRSGAPSGSPPGPRSAN